MKEMKLQALLCVEGLLVVEKMGSVWVREDLAVEVTTEIDDAKAKEGAKMLSEQKAEFDDENIENGSTGLARE